MKKKLMSLILAVVMLVSAFLPNLGTLTVNAATTVEDHMIVTSPWAYRYGSMDNSQTYTDGGYEYATLIPGSGTAYNGALMRDVKLSDYQEIRFAVKTNGSYYYEGGRVANSEWGMISGANTTWREWSFKYEADGSGNMGYRLYRDGSVFGDYFLSEDANLSDLQMKFSNNSAGILYMTEVRGVLKTEPSLKFVADSFNDKTGTTIWTEKANGVAKKTTQVTTSWSGTKTSLTSVDLSVFDKIIFYARRVTTGSSATWFESDILGSYNDFGDNWIEFKFVKNADGTWNYYLGGVQKGTSLALTNLSDVTATYGNNTYYFSEVFGIYSEGATIPWNGEYMVVTSPWAYRYGSMDNSQTYVEGGYEYATLVPGSGTAYNGALMRDVELSNYQELRFAVKTNGTSYYYEVGKVADGNFSLFAGANDSAWREFTLKYEDDGAGNVGYRLYRDGGDTGNLLAADMNLSDLQMKFSSNTAGILYMTEVRGTLKEGANPALEVVADSFNEKTGTVDWTVKANIAAKKSIKVDTTWSGTKVALTAVDLGKYDKIVFYTRRVTTGSSATWFESDLLGSYNDFADNWVEFKFVKNADSTWSYYLGGVQKGTNLALNNLSDITATYGNNTYYFSEVFGVASETSDELPEIWGDLVVPSPWAYQYGTTVNDQTQTADGYEYVTTISGNSKAYDLQATMKDADMSVYSEFRFAVKTIGSTWNKYQVKQTGDDTSFENAGDILFEGADETVWTEYAFVCETDSNGDAGFHMYKAGEETEVWLPADTNLSDLQMRASYSGEDTLYLTELRGVLKEGAQISLEILADSFNTLSGDTVTTEKPNAVATKSTKVSTGYWNNEQALTSVELTDYEKILFYARKAGDGTGWFESANHLSSFAIDYVWVEFKLVQNADNTWNIYVGGVLKKQNLTLNNLSDVTAKYGINNYYFSEVFGVLSDDVSLNSAGLVQILKAKDAYEKGELDNIEKFDLLQNDVINWRDVKWLRQDILEKEHEFVVVTSPWAYSKGNMDNSETYAAAGYKYATVISGSSNAYKGALMRDVELSDYQELRFAVKTNGSYYYEAGRVAVTDEWSMISGANTSWREWALKYESDADGNMGYRLYRDGSVFGDYFLSEDANLSDLQMKFSSNTAGILYMTEVRGIVKDGAKLPLKTVTESFNTETGTISEKEAAIIDANISTEVTCKWSSTKKSLSDVDLSLYSKILFYARKTSSSYDTNAWLESNYLGSFVVTDSWTEFKLLKNTDETWDIYVGGLLKQSNLALTNLSEITATYGNDSYYFSEVLGVQTAKPIVLLNDSQKALYSVVYGDSSDSFAASEFTSYMENSTGVAYTATQVSSTPSENEKKIVVGKSLATKAGLDTSKLSTDNGYAITRRGNNLYIYGKTTQGTLNGVYALLKDAVGLEIYTDEVSTDTYKSGAITLNKTNVVFNPGIDYLYDMNRETRDNTSYGKKLGFTLDWNHLGGSDHEESVFISSSYYTGTTSNGHINLTNDKTQEEVAEYLYDTYVVGKPGLSDFRFGLLDDTKWFDSTAAGSARTAQYVAFMNQVAIKLQALMEANDTTRDINLILLAYLNTVQAPTDGTQLESTENITLQVAYAPVEANWYIPLTHEDNNRVPSEVSSSATYDADAELQKWANLAGTGNVLLWAYHAFPGNYLTPFDSLNALQKNYALAAEYGVSAVYDIVQWAPDSSTGATLGDCIDTSTDWTRLKVYLANELAKNPTMSETEYNHLIDNFMNAYFMVEEVATAMKEALSVERTLMSEVYANVKSIGNISYSETCGFDDYYGSVGGYHTLIDQTVTSLFGSKNSNTRNAAWGWNGSGDHPVMAVYIKMKAAYDAVATAQSAGTITSEEATTLKERIQLEAISVRFILLRVANKDVSSSFGGRSGYDGLAADCISLGITKIGENSNGGTINRDMTAENLQKNDL